MGVSYEKNKVHILKWRLNNMDKYRAIDAALKRRKYKPTLPYSYEHAARLLRNIRI